MAKSTTPKKSNPSLKALEITTGDRNEAVKAAGGKAVQDIKMIPIDQIKILPGLQPRLEDEVGYDEGIEAITKSIEAFGFMQDKPLTVFTSVDDDLNPVTYVSDGHGRLEAAKRAISRDVEIDALPCVYVDVNDSPWFDASLDRRNMTQRALTPMSQAVHVRRALAAGKTPDEVAAMLDITRRYVYDLELLSKAPPPVRSAVKSGVIKAYKVILLMRKHAEELEKVTEIVGAVVAEKLAKEQARTAAKESGEKAPRAAKKIRWSDLIEAEAGGEIEKEQMDAFAPFFDEDVWASMFAPSRSKKRYKVLKNVKIKISIVRDADDETTEVSEEDEDDGLGEAPAAEAAPRKRRGGGRKKAAEAEAPDISAIADPA